jgi:RNA polymerase sigma-70 factor, ECF subfamily
LKLQPTSDFEKIQSGDIATFEKVFREYYEYLCFQAYKILRDRDEAEEIVQDTFVKIWNKRHDIQINLSLKGYLAQTIRNGCYNQIKYNQVRREYASMAQKEMAIAEHGELLVPDELAEKINRAIDNLPAERKKIFLMSRHDGLKYQEIADALGISVKTVESQMGKALKYLREDLKEYLVIAFLLFFEMLKDL